MYDKQTYPRFCRTRLSCRSSNEKSPLSPAVDALNMRRSPALPHAPSIRLSLNASCGSPGIPPPSLPPVLEPKHRNVEEKPLNNDWSRPRKDVSAVLCFAKGGGVFVWGRGSSAFSERRFTSLDASY